MLSFYNLYKYLFVKSIIARYAQCALLIILFCITANSQNKYRIDSIVTYNKEEFLDTFVIVEKGGHLIIPEGSIITIEKYIGICVYGKITAKGTKNKPIIFKVDDTTDFTNTSTLNGGWNGISFFGCNTDTSIIEYCIIQNVKSTESPDLDGSGIYLNLSNKVIIRFTTLQNNIGRTGGGIRIYNSSPVISQCTFKNNTALEGGGGLYAYNSNGLIINNCIFSGNYSINGAALYLQNSEKIQIINNTIVKNVSSQSGSALLTKNSKNISLYNNIIYYNTGSGEDQLDFYNTNLIFIVFNNLENQHLFPIGWDNLDIDPHFVDLNNGDYRLLPESKCIDAGKNKYQQGFYDADGKARFWPKTVGQEPIIDLGAYEYNSHFYPVLSYTKEDITNIENVNGRIALLVDEGTAPFKYLWNDGNTDSIRTNLVPNIYKVYVEDVYGLKDSAEISINFADSFYYIKGNVQYNKKNITSGVVMAFENSNGNYIFRNLGEIIQGQYLIPALENKNYLLYAIPSNNYFQEYIPGYYVNKNNWDKSYQYYLQGNAHGVDISLQKLKHTEKGLCSIAGKLALKSGNEIKKIQDKLPDPKNRTLLGSLNYPVMLVKNNEIIGWTFCDSNEGFNFYNLSYGNYTVRLEYPGKIMQQNYTITLNEKNQIKEVLLAMDKNMIQTYLVNDISTPFNQSFCYPNPVEDKIYITFNYFPVTNLNLAVYTFEGRLIKQELVKKLEGTLTITSDLSEVAPGIYILKMYTNDKSKFFKIVKF